MSSSQRERLAAETVEEEARLQQIRSSQAERLTSESVEERETRLQQLRDRLAAASIEEREVRLQQMDSSQRERLAPENAEEREVRLRHDKREPQGEASAGNTGQLHLPLIQQRFVQAKMQKFHAHMAALEVLM